MGPVTGRALAPSSVEGSGAESVPTWALRWAGAPVFALASASARRWGAQLAAGWAGTLVGPWAAVWARALESVKGPALASTMGRASAQGLAQ
jgi:hypothetical protein